MTLADILTNIGVVTDWLLGTIGDVVTTITTTPVLMLTFGLPLALVGITVLKRFMSVRP